MVALILSRFQRTTGTSAGDLQGTDSLLSSSSRLSRGSSLGEWIPSAAAHWPSPMAHSDSSSSSSRSPSPQSNISSRIHALGLEVTGLENKFARMLDTYNSLPQCVSEGSLIDPEHSKFCRRAFNGQSDLFSPIHGLKSHAIEAPHLRSQSSRAHTLLCLHHYSSATAILQTAEQDMPTYLTHLSNLQFALSHLTLAAQYTDQISHLRSLHKMIFTFENTYVKLKSRFHALPAATVTTTNTPNSEAGADYCWNEVTLDEAFGESLLEHSEIEMKTRRLHAIAGKVARGLEAGRGDQVEDLLHEADVLVEEVEEYLLELKKSVGAQEDRARVWSTARSDSAESMEADDGSLQVSDGE